MNRPLMLVMVALVGCADLEDIRDAARPGDRSNFNPLPLTVTRVHRRGECPPAAGVAN